VKKRLTFVSILVALLGLIFIPLAFAADPLGGKENIDWLIVKKLTVLEGGATFNSALTLVDSAFDMNGQELTLDADADTSITADTDDQIDLEINGADEFVFTADQLDMTLGQLVNIGAAGTDFGSDGSLTTAQTVSLPPRGAWIETLVSG
jgi:hypothetical protein